MIIRFSHLLPLFFLLSALGCGKGEAPEEFGWRNAEGAKLDVYLSQYPYSESRIKRIPEFEERTVDVSYRIETESSYYQVLNEKIQGASRSPDVYMAGAYHLWNYEARGFVEDLEPNIADPLLTGENYDWYKAGAALGDGYGETLSAMIDSSYVQFSPSGKNMALDLLWSRAIRKIVLDEEASIPAELNSLKEEMDRLLSE